MFGLATWSSMTSATGFGGIVAFFVGICLHISAQFDILCIRLERLFDHPAEVVKLNDKQNDEMREKLEAIVKQHEALINLVDIFADIMTPIVMLHFIASAAVICSCCLMLFLTTGGEWAQYFLFAFVVVAEAFVFSLAGHMLITSSSAMNEAAYNFLWYKCDRRNQNIICMIIARAQRKISFKVPFFEASFETFLAVSFSNDNQRMCTNVQFPDYASSRLIFNVPEELHLNKVLKL